MATVPPLPTFPSNTVVTSGQLTALSTALGFQVNTRPIVSAYQSVTQTLGQSSWVSITMTQVVVDSDAGHTEQDASVYRCKTAGWWWVEGSVTFVGALGSPFGRLTRLALNGQQVIGSVRGVAENTGATVTAHTGKLVLMAVGDALQVQGYQESSNAARTDCTDVHGYSSLDAYWLRAA